MGLGDLNICHAPVTVRSTDMLDTHEQSWLSQSMVCVPAQFLSGWEVQRLWPGVEQDKEVLARDPGLNLTHSYGGVWCWSYRAKGGWAWLWQCHSCASPVLVSSKDHLSLTSFILSSSYKAAGEKKGFTALVKEIPMTSLLQEWHDILRSFGKRLSACDLCFQDLNNFKIKLKYCFTKDY